MSLRLPIEPGLVSVFYFVFLDLVLLTNLDTALSRLLSHFYLRQIYSGRPLLLRTVDVPGITSFLLGRRLALINVIALLVKLLFISFVLILDLNINADTIEPVRLLSTFEMNVTEEAWADGVKIKEDVERRWDAARGCYVIAKPTEYRIADENGGGFNDSVMYYHIAFNLTKGYEFTKDETLPVNNTNSNRNNSRSSQKAIIINDHTLHCLRPDHVLKPKPLIRVLGCSTVERPLTASCAAQARTSRPAASLSFRVSYDHYFLDVNHSGPIYTSQTYQFDTPAELQPVFPEYVGPGKRTELFCLKQGYTVPQNIWPQIRTWCLLVMRYNGTTLFERWTYHRKTNTVNRIFSGPIFDRDLDVGSWQMANFVWNALVDIDWRVLSGIIVASASVYVFDPRDVEVIIDSRRQTVTKIPTEAVVVFVFMTAAVIMIRLVVYFGVERGDRRPQLNVVNGVSSIGREELVPTGGSQVRGKPMMVGFRQKGNAMLHFGPLAKADDAVKVIKGVDIL